MKELIERINKRINTEVLRIGAYDGELVTLLSQCKAALSQKQEAKPVFMWHKGATDEESEVVDVDCACPCCAPLYTAPPSTAQGDPEEIRERVARIINTKGYEKLHCIVGQKGAEDIRFLVDCLRGV